MYYPIYSLPIAWRYIMMWWNGHLCWLHKFLWDPQASFTIAPDNFDKRAVHNLFESFLRRHVCKPAIEIDWRAKIMGNCAWCRGEPKIVNNSNHCFPNQKDDLRLLWLWKLLIKLRRSGRRHFCIAESSFKDLDHNISETRIWRVLTSRTRMRSESI